MASINMIFYLFESSFPNEVIQHICVYRHQAYKFDHMEKMKHVFNEFNNVIGSMKQLLNLPFDFTSLKKHGTNNPIYFCGGYKFIKKNKKNLESVNIPILNTIKWPLGGNNSYISSNYATISIIEQTTKNCLLEMVMTNISSCERMTFDEHIENIKSKNLNIMCNDIITSDIRKTLKYVFE